MFKTFTSNKKTQDKPNCGITLRQRERKVNGNEKMVIWRSSEAYDTKGKNLLRGMRFISDIHHNGNKHGVLIT